MAAKRMDVGKRVNVRSVSRKSSSVLAVAALLTVISGCSDDDDSTTPTTPTTAVAPADPVAAAEQRVAVAEDGLTQSQEALTTAHAEFCDTSSGYVETLDRYGRVFTDSAATVGDVQTLGADLIAPREEVVAAADGVYSAKNELADAQQELVDAQNALADAIATASSVPNTAETATTSTTTTLVPLATIERVQQAEDDLARVSEGITEETPLVEAAANYNSAALALQISWLVLLNDAQCLTDEQQAQAVEQIVAYTTALQTDLTTAGFDPGPIDGVYGPATVAAVEQLQSDSGLRVTGFVDEATSRALQVLLDAVGQAQATQTTMVQTILSLAGFWDGPTDGIWTDELTQALMDFQTALGVEPTGVVDAATIAAYQRALAGLGSEPTPTTAPTVAATTAPPQTVAPTTPPTATTAAPDPDPDPDPEGEATVLIVDSELGQILTAADGVTVYLFTDDDQGEPTCTGGCAGTWPPLTVADPSDLIAGDDVDASLLGSVTNSDGETQVTYNDWPLYFFAGDNAPGDTNGQGQGGVWFVVDPTGNPVDKN